MNQISWHCVWRLYLAQTCRSTNVTKMLLSLSTLSSLHQRKLAEAIVFTVCCETEMMFFGFGLALDEHFYQALVTI